MFKNYESLPERIKERIKTLHPRDYEEWVYVSIPALNNLSIIQTINTENGIVELNKYLNRIESYLGIK